MDLHSNTRRGFFGRLAAAVAALASWRAGAQTPAAPAAHPHHGPMTHNGLIYISGQGANDAGAVQGQDIRSHVTKVMENIKRVVESGGGTMDSILQLNVYLATLEDYEAMNEVYRTYFPHGGPARMTVAVAGVPGRSLLEINGIAAVVNPPASA